jgi:hypothetical protein
MSRHTLVAREIVRLHLLSTQLTISLLAKAEHAYEPIQNPGSPNPVLPFANLLVRTAIHLPICCWLDGEALWLPEAF